MCHEGAPPRCRSGLVVVACGSGEEHELIISTLKLCSMKAFSKFHMVLYCISVFENRERVTRTQPSSHVIFTACKKTLLHRCSKAMVWYGFFCKASAILAFPRCYCTVLYCRGDLFVHWLNARTCDQQRLHEHHIPRSRSQVGCGAVAGRAVLDDGASLPCYIIEGLGSRRHNTRKMKYRNLQESHCVSEGCKCCIFK